MAPLPGWLVVISSAAFWLLVSLLVGLVANQLPAAWLLGRPGLQEPGRA